MLENKLKGGKLGQTLRKIKGLNTTKIKELLDISGISERCYLSDLSKRHQSKLFLYLTNLKKEGEIEEGLTKKVRDNIELEIKLNTYRGSRHKHKLPIKGRTRSNGKTRRRWTYT